MNLIAKIALPREHKEDEVPEKRTIARGEAFTTTKERGKALIDAGKAEEAPASKQSTPAS